MNVALGRSGEDNFEAGDHDAKNIVEKVRCMSAKASHSQPVEGHADQTEDDHTIVGLMKKYPWWPLKARRRSERGCNPGGQVFSGTFI